MTAIIHGRPDLHGDPGFGVTTAKRHPPYVYSTGPGAALVHRVARMRLWWYDIGPGGHTLVRRASPRVLFDAACGQMLFAEPKRRGGKRRAVTCELPAPGAMLCGRCHGEPAPFGRHGPATAAGVTRTAAGAALGCMAEAYGFGV